MGVEREAGVNQGDEEGEDVAWSACLDPSTYLDHPKLPASNRDVLGLAAESPRDKTTIVFT